MKKKEIHKLRVGRIFVAFMVAMAIISTLESALAEKRKFVFSGLVI